MSLQKTKQCKIKNENENKNKRKKETTKIKLWKWLKFMPRFEKKIVGSLFKFGNVKLTSSCAIYNNLDMLEHKIKSSYQVAQIVHSVKIYIILKAIL